MIGVLVLVVLGGADGGRTFPDKEAEVSRVKRLYSEGQRLCLAGQRVAALSEFREVVAMSLSDTWSVKALAAAARCSPNASAGIELRYELVRKFPNSLEAEEAKMTLANELAAEGRYEEAGDLLLRWGDDVEWSPQINSLQVVGPRLMVASQMYSFAGRPEKRRATLERILLFAGTPAQVAKFKVVALCARAMDADRAGNLVAARRDALSAVLLFESEAAFMDRSASDSAAIARDLLARRATQSASCSSVDECAAELAWISDDLARVGMKPSRSTLQALIFQMTAYSHLATNDPSIERRNLFRRIAEQECRELLRVSKLSGDSIDIGCSIDARPIEADRPPDGSKAKPEGHQ